MFLICYLVQQSKDDASISLDSALKSISVSKDPYRRFYRFILTNKPAYDQVQWHLPKNKTKCSGKCQPKMKSDDMHNINQNQPSNTIEDQLPIQSNQNLSSQNDHQDLNQPEIQVSDQPLTIEALKLFQVSNFPKTAVKCLHDSII